MRGRNLRARPGRRCRQRFRAPGFNVCPADPADVVPHDDARELVAMRWGLVPYYGHDTATASQIDGSANGRPTCRAPAEATAAPAEVDAGWGTPEGPKGACKLGAKS